MSGLTYESLLQSIRDAPYAAAGADDPPLSPVSVQSASFDDLFGINAGNQRSGGGAPTSSEPPPPLFDLPLARLASGWGAVVGLVVGALVGAKGGFAWLVVGAAAGTALGSLAGIAALGLFAGATYRFGASWMLILAAIAAGLGLAAIGQSF